MTGGAEINFGGDEKFILSEFERGTGAREIYPCLDQMNKVRSKNSRDFPAENGNSSALTGDLQKKKGLRSNFKEFSGRNRKFKWFFRPKRGDLQKKKKKKKEKGLHPKNVTKSGVSPQKTLIWASMCAPKAPSLLISSGHSPRLGGHNFRLGGAQWGGAPVCPPVAPGPIGGELLGGPGKTPPTLENSVFFFATIT